jgi:phospholipase A1
VFILLLNVRQNICNGFLSNQTENESATRLLLKGIIMSKKLIVGLLLAYSSNGFAQVECLDIVDDLERLACYDNAINEPLVPSPSLETTEATAEKASTNFNLESMGFAGIINYFDEQKLLKLSPHEPSYILPFSYNGNPNSDIFQQIKPGSEVDKIEVKFQISTKLKLLDDVYNDNWDLWFGYTQTAWWQLYNSGESAPFRDTNYSPEIFASYYSNIEFFGFTLLESDIGLIHQSNGQSEILSRSWNRIYANFQLVRGDYLLEIQPWYRLPEDPEDDDNPNIEKYLGYGNFRLLYKNGEHIYSVLLRNNLRFDDNKGAVELSWTFPLYDTARLYVQYFNGYGESLLDYNHSSNRLSVGILLYDWI